MDTILAGSMALLTLATSACAQSASPRGQTLVFENLVHQAEAARDAKRLDEAFSLYERAIKLKPDWEDGWGSAGSLAYDLEKYSECAADFRHLTSLNPGLAPAWTMQGLCEFQLRDYKAALKSLTQVQHLGPLGNPGLSSTSKFHLALVLTKLGYSEKAIEWLYKVIRIEGKKTPEIVVALGIAGLRKPWIPSEVPESYRDKVLKLGDAMATFMLGDVEESFREFEAGLRDYPMEPDFHYRFGAFLAARNLDRGVDEIKKTLELEPGHVPALVALARIYVQRGKSETALPYVRRAVELSPADVAARVTLGQVLLTTGDMAGAVREFELSAKLAPESPEVHYKLGSAYSRMGRKADATRELAESERLRKSQPP
jgi:tetratricopeptide (TPR) repeat protein